MLFTYNTYVIMLRISIARVHPRFGHFFMLFCQCYVKLRKKVTQWSEKYSKISDFCHIDCQFITYPFVLCIKTYILVSKIRKARLVIFVFFFLYENITECNWNKRGMTGSWNVAIGNLCLPAMIDLDVHIACIDGIWSSVLIYSHFTKCEFREIDFQQIKLIESN